MVWWFIHLTLYPKAEGSSPSLALVSFGRTLINICFYTVHRAVNEC